MGETPGNVVPTLWAYAYEVLPPQPSAEWAKLRALLDEEHAAAEREGRRWTGKLVYKQLVTHLLVVSDHPDQDRDINRRVEEWLKVVSPAYSMTVPKALVAEPPSRHPAKRHPAP
ncbi:MAG TPA: hypothetical protein VF862_03820 [Gemmatimonadales bacterium]